MIDTRTRTSTRVVLTLAVSATAILVATYLVWGLRRLVVPVFVGGLLAYICRPLVARLERYRAPRSIAMGTLLLVFAVLAILAINAVLVAIPSEHEALELRIRGLYALNHRYQAIMGLDPSWTRGNRLYAFTHGDLDPLLDRASDMLALTADERAQFIASLQRDTDASAARANRLLAYQRANEDALDMRARHTVRAAPTTTAVVAAPSDHTPTAAAETGAGGLHAIFSSWMIAPLVFLFLLWDTGDIKRGLLSIVPNRFFEPALAVLADLDHALGSYVRGIALECCLLGGTVMVLVTFVGVPFRWAIPIGIFTAATNVVPYMGFAAALVSGLGYALLADEIHPLLPFVTPETFAVWVVVAVALAELIKNAVYEPIVLGGAVSLHPLVVVIGIVGAAIVFGPVGMLLAIPTITVVRVVVASTARHLKAYGLI